jgi:hypothetical protein
MTPEEREKEEHITSQRPHARRGLNYFFTMLEKKKRSASSLLFLSSSTFDYTPVMENDEYYSIDSILAEHTVRLQGRAMMILQRRGS